MPDFVLSLFVRLIHSSIAFIAFALIARHFGEGGKGDLVESQFVPTFLLIVVIKLGMDTASTIILRKHKELKDSILGSYIILTATLSLFVCLLQQPFMDSFWSVHYKLDYLYIAMWLLPCQLLHDLCSSSILGSSSFRRFTQFKLVQPSLFFVAIVMLWLLEKYLYKGENSLNPHTALMAYPLSFGLTALIMFLYLLKDLKIRFDQSLVVIKKMISIGIPIQVITVLMFLNRRIDVLFITIFLNTDKNGIYSAVVALIEIAWFASRPLSSMVLIRSISEKDDGSCGRILRFTLFISIIILAILVALVPVILKFYGSKFYLGYMPFLCLIPGVLLFNIHQVLSQVFIARGQSRRLIPLMLIGLIVNLILNYLLINTYKLNGVALASSISYSLISVGVLVMSSKTLKINIWNLIIPKRKDFQMFYSKIKK